jgi:N-formylglutamate deformylase
MVIDRIWTEESTPDADRTPVLGFAIHDGHVMRDEIEANTALSDSERLREEDPYTGTWTLAAPTRVMGIVSRFEVDLNRPRDKAVYQRPEDAWGLNLWRQPLSDAAVDRSLAQYDEFYRAMDGLLRSAAERFGKFIVVDIHSYNHRRDGADGPPADEAANPQVNVGTGTMDRSRWAPVVDRFIGELGAYPFPGGQLDVRENVKFRGGYFPRWIHDTFPDNACAISVEFKKFFMDEWTGEPDEATVEAIGAALAAVVPPMVEELTTL